MSTPALADRNLLGGVLALQMDFVTGEQLLAAMNAWVVRKETPLLDLLRQDGILNGDDHDALSRLVERTSPGTAATRKRAWRRYTSTDPVLGEGGHHFLTVHSRSVLS